VIEREFRASKVASDFLLDDKNSVQLIMGCVGSGKSSVCVIKIWQMAMTMPPGFDGIRRSKWAIIRSTYSQLETTTVKTWHDWIPASVFGHVRGKSPLYHSIKKGDIECEVIFLALDSVEDIERLKSLELTGAYINEAQFIHDFRILTTVYERTNRFPAKKVGGALNRFIVFLDCNPPSNRHWIYKTFEVDKPEGFAIYKMPPAVIRCDEEAPGAVRDTCGVWWCKNPDADYTVQHSDPDYWIKQVPHNDTDHIRKELCGEYGVSKGGRPVHPEYTDSIHYTNRVINYEPSIKLGFGIDFGNTPAFAIVQFLPNGQLVVLDELWTEYMQLRPFLEDVVIPHLDTHYAGWRDNHEGCHDPSGEANLPGGGTCQTILREYGIKSQPAQTNDPIFRRDGLKYFLKKLPPLLVSEKCPMIREGLQGEFQFELIKSTELSGDKQYKDKPKKNIFSHICEGLEYIATYYAPQHKKSEKKPTEKKYKIYRGSFMGL
jgi:hypothetical protein